MDEPRRELRFYSAFAGTCAISTASSSRNARAFPLGREEIGELLRRPRGTTGPRSSRRSSARCWSRRSTQGERRKLGAHYTPRAYVERLVEATVMEPLRADWEDGPDAGRAAPSDDGRRRATRCRASRAFHRQLCATRVLDPACGTGNFLYVSLELMKRLEGEVLETLAKLGEPESMGLDRETVDPHQFLGLELNPRAAAIAELVLWIGYLQQHYRTRTGHPAEPILRAFENINFGRRARLRRGADLGRLSADRGAWRRTAAASRPIRIRAGRNGRRRSSSWAIRRSSAARTCASRLATATRRRCGRRTRT